LDKLETIQVEKKQGVATVTLNRPEVRNAMNLQMIRELNTTLEELNGDSSIRLIRFNSTGDHFCAGADLEWMRAGQALSEDQLKRESLELAGLFRNIRESAAVTICSVKGRVPGGAVGLLAASDLVVAERSVVLRFPEVKLGLIPATVAPYVLRKAGYARTADWMLTGRLIQVSEAKEAGLVHRICGEGSMEATTDELVKELLSGGIQALKGVKSLLRNLEDLSDPEEVDIYTAGLIAGFRAGREGQERMKAFLEKRKPRWNEAN
jgi:methylglutaconyl-CoA hydratase